MDVFVVSNLQFSPPWFFMLPFGKTDWFAFDSRGNGYFFSSTLVHFCTGAAVVWDFLSLQLQDQGLMLRKKEKPTRSNTKENYNETLSPS